MEGMWGLMEFALVSFAGPGQTVLKDTMDL